MSSSKRSEDNKSLVPFLKWAGGKRWLVTKNLSLFPDSYNRYIEPFLGSGAVFFSLRPKKATLSDINKDLIKTYRAIKYDWKKVFEILKKHHKNHNKQYYYKLRAAKPSDRFELGAWFIYFNRTCWNGLYRVNLKGEFNVPIGTKTEVILDTDNFVGIARALLNTKLIHKSFKDIINNSKKNDLIFVDPPYTVKHRDNGFIKYNEELFKWSDQELLSECLHKARERGAKIVMTNADHDEIKRLYKKPFEIITVNRSSVIAANPAMRGKCSELIIKG